MAKSPDAFRTISEVATELDVPQHVLRFWETKFSQIKPLKRGGGRRYYRPEDVEVLRGIRALLYNEGFTIKGVQKVFREQGQRFVAESAHAKAGTAAKRMQPGLPPEAMPLAPAARPPAGSQGAASAAETRVPSRSELDAALQRLVEAKALLERRRTTQPLAPTVRARTA